MPKTSHSPFNNFHSKRSPRQRVPLARSSAQTQLRLVSSTVYLTGKPEIEVQLALTRLLTSAGATMGVNPLVRTVSNSSGLGTSRHDSTDNARRLDESFRKANGDRPASILEKTRASLLGRDAELESPRGHSPVRAALHPVCRACTECVSIIDLYGSFDRVT